MSLRDKALEQYKEPKQQEEIEAAQRHRQKTTQTIERFTKTFGVKPEKADGYLKSIDKINTKRDGRVWRSK